MSDDFATINEWLVHLINEIWELETKAIITDEFKDISNNDMHVIEAIGLGNGNNMSTIAKKLNITVGSLTTAMNSLVRKEYVTRRRGEDDRRVVFICLTEKGRQAYRHHEDFHRLLTEGVMKQLDEEEMPVMIRALEGLTEFFHTYSEQNQK